MVALQTGWQRITALLSSRAVEAAALLLTRFALAGVFWRSGRAKIEDGSWLSISDATYYLFREEYTRVPLPPVFAAVAAAMAEHIFPVLLVIGFGVRLSALGLLGMTIVIQLFVYPEAWWPVHSLWAALALVLIARGGGMLSLDTLFSRPAR
ncbi:DoxX family protein [Sphingosinicella sp.]|uniref:DoxX family protein n=1 Tax=Sphingosinicella sp. TaxID=1917971 RepID=UPI0035B10D9E